MKKHSILITVLFVFAAAVTAHAKIIEVANQYIRISVDDMTGRFFLETTGGDPDTTADDNKQLLYKKTPPTSMTTLNIDGEIIIFGSEAGGYKKRAEAGDNKITTEWSVRGIDIVQELSIVKGPSTGREDCMSIVYKVRNDNRRTTPVGLRILFDTYLGESDGVSFRIPGIGDINRESQFYRADIPEYWYSFDSFTNPTIRSQGILRGTGVTTPDRVIFASWDRLYDNLWDFNVDSSRTMQQTGTSRLDSAVALLYDPIKIEKDKTMVVTAMYGLYGASFFNSDNLVMSLSVPAQPDTPPVPVSVEVMNTSKTVLDKLKLTLTLPAGFTLASGESNTVEFIRVGTNETKKAIWYLNCGTIGGTFTVKVNAMGIINNNVQTVNAEKTFVMNYNANVVVTQTNAVVVQRTTTNVTQVQAVRTNQQVVTQVRTNTVLVQQNPNQQTLQPVRQTNRQMSQQELDLVKEIDDLSKLIEEVNQKYQVLLGVYNNTYLSNEVVSNVNIELDYYRNRVAQEETALSNEQASISGRPE